MSIDLKYGRCCDGCGRSMEKAHRIHGSLEFCGSCYAREFVPTPCATCGTSTRTYRGQIEPAKCQPCVFKERVCLRCEKPLPRAALRVGARYACAACAPHFYEPRPCSNCGVPARRLSCAPSLGFDTPICDKCRRGASDITCTICRRSRPAASTLANGGNVCKQCLENPTARHDCPGCGVSLPGVGAGRCRSCLNRDGITRTMTLLTASLAQPWSRKMALDFGDWLCEKYPQKPALVTLAKTHLVFFTALDGAFDGDENLTAAAIAEKLSTPFLRKHLLCKQFLASRYQLVLDSASQKALSEKHQIHKKLASVALSPYGALLAEYETWLMASEVKTQTRRLYLRAAENLCTHAALSPESFAASTLDQTQARFRSFTKHHRGSLASAGRFVRYLNQRIGLELSLPTSQVQVDRKPVAVKRLGMLIRAVKSVGVQQADNFSLLRLTGIALGFTGLTMEQIESCQADGSEFVILGEVVKIPKELRPFAGELAVRFLAQSQNEGEMV